MPSKKNGYNKPGTLFATVAAVVVLIFAVVGIRMGATGVISPVKYVFMDTSGHIQRVLYAPLRWGKELWGSYVALQGLKVENEALRDEIHRLRQELARYREAIIANERLRRLLALKERVPGPGLAANVVGVDLAPWSATLTIDLGKKDGVEPGMAVLCEAGVIGQVIDSSTDFSKVLLITDVKSAVAAVVQRNRSRGILKGTGDKACELAYVEKGVDVQPGDIIVTSGTDGVFPKGLLLGRVTYVSQGAAPDLFQEIRVEPVTDPKKVEEVIVLAGGRPLAGGRS